MKKRIIGLLLANIMLVCSVNVAFGATNSEKIHMKQTENGYDVEIQENICEILTTVDPEICIDEVDEIHIVEGSCQTDSDEETAGEEMGVLQVISHDEKVGMGEIESYVFLEDDGSPMSAQSLSYSMCNSALQGTDHVKIQSRYRLYTDGLISVYINPYSVSLTPQVSGITYMAGDVMFHGIQVNTSDFKDIKGTDCTIKYKSKTVSSGIEKGTTYKSAGYALPVTKAIRIYACGFHSMCNMYLEYTLNGKTHKGTYAISNF